MIPVEYITVTNLARIEKECKQGSSGQPVVDG